MDPCPRPCYPPNSTFPRLGLRVVVRPRLIERLNEGLQRAPGVTLVSASAGFGKTTLLSEWIATLTPSPLPAASRPAALRTREGEGQGVRVAWLSLDEGDNDPARFLMYFVAALQTIAPQIGAGVLAALQSPAAAAHRRAADHTAQ